MSSVHGNESYFVEIPKQKFPYCQHLQGCHVLPTTLPGLTQVQGGPGNAKERSVHHGPRLALMSITVSPWTFWWIFKDINSCTGSGIVHPWEPGGSVHLPKCSISFPGATELPQRDEAHKPLHVFVGHFSLVRGLQDSLPTGSSSQHMSLGCTLYWNIVLCWGWIKCTITAHFLKRSFDNDKCVDIFPHSDNLIPCPSSGLGFTLKNWSLVNRRTWVLPEKLMGLSSNATSAYHVPSERGQLSYSCWPQFSMNNHCTSDKPHWLWYFYYAKLRQHLKSNYYSPWLILGFQWVLVSVQAGKLFFCLEQWWL